MHVMSLTAVRSRRLRLVKEWADRRARSMQESRRRGTAQL